MVQLNGVQVRFRSATEDFRVSLGPGKVATCNKYFDPRFICETSTNTATEMTGATEDNYARNTRQAGLLRPKFAYLFVVITAKRQLGDDRS